MSNNSSGDIGTPRSSGRRTRCQRQLEWWQGQLPGKGWLWGIYIHWTHSTLHRWEQKERMRERRHILDESRGSFGSDKEASGKRERGEREFRWLDVKFLWEHILSNEHVYLLFAAMPSHATTWHCPFNLLQTNEVANDYNAGFQSALAALHQIFN